MLIWLKKNSDILNELTFAFAAHHGNLENIMWLKKSRFLWNEDTFTGAADHGSLKTMKWLKKKMGVLGIHLLLGMQLNMKALEIWNG